VGIELPICPKDMPKNKWMPQPTEEAIAACGEQTKQFHNKKIAVCGAYVCGVFEQAKAWLGDVAALTMPYGNPDRLRSILDHITDWKMAIYSAYVKAGVDIVWIGDDLGMQHTLIMSPADYRKWYQPRHKQIINYLRGIRSDIIIAYHSCGYVIPLISDLIEIGIDILETIQPEAMDITYLKREFGQDLTFWGGIGQQSVLSRTIPQQVMEGIRETLHIMAPGGGYIAAPSNRLTDDISYESLLIFYEAMKRYGNYPNGWLKKHEKRGNP